MAQPVLKCQHLGIQFGGLKAVDDFNMEIGESELVGLIGPNGAGKTTVFNLITGVYKPTEGSLYLNGERMNGKKTHQIVHAGIARTFQNIRLFKKMTVIENVKAAMLEELTYNMPQAIFRTKAYWQQEAAATARAKELLQVVHLSGKENLEADNLPYGEQGGGFARAVCPDQGYDLAVIHMQRYAVQRVYRAVIDMKVFYFKHPLRPPPLCLCPGMLQSHGGHWRSLPVCRKRSWYQSPAPGFARRFS